MYRSIESDVITNDIGIYTGSIQVKKFTKDCLIHFEHDNKITTVKIDPIYKRIIDEQLRIGRESLFVSLNIQKCLIEISVFWHL